MGFYGDSGGGSGLPTYMQSMVELINPEAVDWANYMINKESVVGEAYNNIAMFENDNLASCGTFEDLCANLPIFDMVLSDEVCLQLFNLSPFVSSELTKFWQGPNGISFNELAFSKLWSNLSFWRPNLVSAFADSEIMAKGLIHEAGLNPNDYPNLEAVVTNVNAMDKIIFTPRSWTYLQRSSLAMEKIIRGVADIGNIGLIVRCWHSPDFKELAIVQGHWQYFTETSVETTNVPSLIAALAGLSITGSESFEDVVNNPTKMTEIVSSIPACSATFISADAMFYMENSPTAINAFATSSRIITYSGSATATWAIRINNMKCFVVAMRQTSNNNVNVTVGVGYTKIGNQQVTAIAPETYNINRPVSRFIENVYNYASTSISGTNFHIIYVPCQ